MGVLIRGMSASIGAAPRAGQPAKSPLGARLRRLVTGAALQSPLPTTRQLGERFGVANTTVFRALQELAEAGDVWQHPINGRYYPPAARALVDRPKPVACLLRRLELGSVLYRELLEGVSSGCGRQGRMMLLGHDDRLVNHPDPHDPPVFASLPEQRKHLRDFLTRHASTAGGYVLDHVWSDRVLEEFSEQLQPAVVLFRRSNVTSLSNVRADFHAGALKALVHLLGRDFASIWPIEPFSGDPAVTEFFAALRDAAEELGCSDRVAPEASASTPRARKTLLDRLRRARQRTALLCPEDHVALLLAEAVRTSSFDCPREVGILTVMGTGLATGAGLSCLRYDFRQLGAIAAETLGQRTLVHHALPPVVVAGATT
jgi:DNA-binding LacI/PurR family transcriptional regulator